MADDKSTKKDSVWKKLKKRKQEHDERKARQKLEEMQVDRKWTTREDQWHSNPTYGKDLVKHDAVTRDDRDIDSRDQSDDDYQNVNEVLRQSSPDDDYQNVNLVKDDKKDHDDKGPSLDR